MFTQAVRHALSSVLFVAILAPGIQAQQPQTLPPSPTADWGNVQQLKRGTYIAVSLESGEELAGQFNSADERTLRMEVEVRGTSGTYALREVSRTEVRRVSRVTPPRNHRRMTAIGMAVGTAVGVGAGAIYDASHPGGEDPGLGKLSGGVAGFFTGAVVGALFGHIHRESIVYQAPAPPATQHAVADAR